MNHPTKQPSVEAPSKVTVEFDSNKRLGTLIGQHDENLIRLEQVLNIVISGRGNKLVIEGDSNTVKLAKNVLEKLYEMTADANSITLSEVDGVVRMIAPELEFSLPKKSKNKMPQPKTKQDSRLVEIKTTKRVITPRSPSQADFMVQLGENDLVFGVGPAGTGKTYLAVAMAVNKMISGEVDRIILSRPAVEAGENLGFLPGDLKEKVDPYLRPLYDALYDMLPESLVERYLESGQIEIAPLAFMRGRTLANSYVILDEAQNTTPLQMKMFLTRFGDNSHMVVAGDTTQKDLPHGQQSGLQHAVDILSGAEGVSITRFSAQDIVRHPLVTRIVDAYEKNPAKSKVGGDRRYASKQSDSEQN